MMAGQKPAAEPAPAAESGPAAEPGPVAGPAPAAESGPAVVCPACGHPAAPEDNFCEACRAELAPVAVSAGEAGTLVCPSCPGAAVSPDGYCESCGRKVPTGRDHVELDLGLVAGVTDRGYRHQRNEDAMALATAQSPGGPVVAAVVCDGVSTAGRPDEASLAAAQAGLTVLAAAARSGSDLAEASAAAVRSAQEALATLTAGAQAAAAQAEGAQAAAAQAEEEPAATYVSAVITGGDMTVCWLGDSRVYWLDAGPDASSQRLTTDDSLAEEIVATGLISEEDALQLPAGHVVTGWIGADLSGAQPHILTFTPPGPGLVLLCSDGLWNYQPSAAGLAGLALPGGLTDPLGTALGLVKFALDAGGRDNITVVLAPFPLNRSPGEPVDEPA